MYPTRRDFLKSMAVAAGVAVAPGVLGAAASAPVRSRPNFLLIVADDMGYSDLGCYGGEIATPNLDRLADRGLRFTQVYSTARCWPSRACILTGYYAQQVRRDKLPGLPGGGTKDARPSWARLLPDMLKPMGYRSYHSGKWHLDGTPAAGGFDRAFDYSDADHHFLPDKKLAEMPTPPAGSLSKEGYFATTAIADAAIGQLKEHARDHGSGPFFQYLAFTEPHFPIQAPQEDIARYKDRFQAGWDTLRQERWKRMTDMHLINCQLSKADPDSMPGSNLKDADLKKRIGPQEVGRAIPWAELNDDQKHFQAAKMAIHAAMVDRIDREVGRVIDQLKAMNAYDNTVIVFVSDNGASAEQMIRAGGHDPSAPMGSPKSYLCLGPGWSTLCNTPFRRHKIWVHEGGISSPFIVHWPAGIAARGELRHNVGHFIDIVPTFLELAGGRSPTTWQGQSVPPPPGKSLVPALETDGAVSREFLWWYHQGNRAIRMGDWKLVSEGAAGQWELYNIRSDRGESDNMALKQPDRVQEMSQRWNRTADQFAHLAWPNGAATSKAAKAAETTD